MEIREATIADYETISALEAEIQAIHVAAEPTLLIPGGVFSRQTYEEIFAAPNEGVLLGIDGGEAVGYLQYEIVDEPQSEFMYAKHIIHVHALSIKAGHRRKGYGEALMNHIIDRAKTQGRTGVTLEVWTFNEAARAFYQRLGFRTYEMKLRLDFTDRNKEHAS